MLRAAFSSPTTGNNRIQKFRPQKGDDLALGFGSVFGLWIVQQGHLWLPVHGLSPVAIVAGDLDGNGLSDLVIDFGAPYGVWHGVLLHALSPEAMVVGRFH
jgi:hypothetical protein